MSMGFLEHEIRCGEILMGSFMCYCGVPLARLVSQFPVNDDRSGIDIPLPGFPSLRINNDRRAEAKEILTERTFLREYTFKDCTLHCPDPYRRINRHIFSIGFWVVILPDAGRYGNIVRIC